MQTITTTTAANYTGNANDDYIAIEKLLWRVVHQFNRKHHGGCQSAAHIDGLKSTADMAYVVAYGEFDASRGVPFSNYVATVAYQALLAEKRHSMRRSNVWAGCLSELVAVGSDGTEQTVEVADDRPADFSQFGRDLSDDAKHVLSVLPTIEPAEYAGQLRSRQYMLKRTLTLTGWNTSRINRAMDEIRSAR